MDRFMWTVVGIIVFQVTIYALFYVGFNTGPNCPGMDPSWLGYCK